MFSNQVMIDLARKQGATTSDGQALADIIGMEIWEYAAPAQTFRAAANSTLARNLSQAALTVTARYFPQTEMTEADRQQVLNMKPK